MRHLYHRGKGGVKIETMHPMAVMTHGILIESICEIGQRRCWLVNHNMPHPPYFRMCGRERSYGRILRMCGSEKT